MNLQDRIRVHQVTLLSDSWYILEKTSFDWRRNDGHWQRMERETHDRGNGAAPEERIRTEVEEELGYRLGAVRKIFEAFMSPGSVTEKLHFFVAEYDHGMRVGDGGGLAHEGEDIETLELPIDAALAMVADGRIVDAKTIMLLQFARLQLFA